ncbi:sodium-dependent nutrient amino acid transporter 1-like isoform X1 [Pieris brassicae]|uniref:sodium-dependent nutrient amino acid transporter 1-like isoform X1 n=2 Tax=Pieris brassicae TaxID=7116 RepID=UPI001E65E51C|nr:sodium-dependent nutrient amino acid transporter 1-like isoform X1 [Pieris brassicae]
MKTNCFYMALTRPNCVVTSGRLDTSFSRTRQYGRTVRRMLDILKTQFFTIALSLTLFNTVRLPREAFRYGNVQYLVVYSVWLVAVGLPCALLQLAMGQLSQQDAVGVWRAVPIFRGVGYIKVLTSYLCCIYSMVYVSLSAAYMIWIGKGSFPLRDCARIQMTPEGYENKMNASECFNSTFLAPFTEQPQYLGIMAILIFILWFFVPLMLISLHKSLKASLMTLAPIIFTIAIVLCVFLSNGSRLTTSLETEDWSLLYRPYIWHSGLVQALLSTSVMSGFLISAGGTLYKQSDVRWTSTFLVITNLLTGWLSVFMWESLAGEGTKDKSFIAILVLIYQSSVTEARSKEWPLLAFAIVLISGVITLLVLLFPIYDKLHRLCGDQWRLFAAATSALGTALTVTVLSRGISFAELLDDLVVPILAVATATFEVLGFVYIYGYFNLKFDLKFITSANMPRFWLVTWWCTPILVVGITGWWLRAVIRTAWSQGHSLWPLVGAFIGILLILIIFAGIAVAKEEQYNLFAKITAAFHPSRLWGPEDPMTRYMWMSQRFSNGTLSSEPEVTDTSNYTNLHNDYTIKNDVKYAENWVKDDLYDPENEFNFEYLGKDNIAYSDAGDLYAIPTVTKSKKRKKDDTFRSPNICMAKGQVGGETNCNCNRHFQLNVPDLRNNEISTSL